MKSANARTEEFDALREDLGAPTPAGKSAEQSYVER